MSNEVSFEIPSEILPDEVLPNDPNELKGLVYEKHRVLPTHVSKFDQKLLNELLLNEVLSDAKCYQMKVFAKLSQMQSFVSQY